MFRINISEVIWTNKHRRTLPSNRFLDVKSHVRATRENFSSFTRTSKLGSKFLGKQNFSQIFLFGNLPCFLWNFFFSPLLFLLLIMIPASRSNVWVSNIKTFLSISTYRLSWPFFSTVLGIVICNTWCSKKLLKHIQKEQNRYYTWISTQLHGQYPYHQTVGLSKVQVKR